MEILAVPERKPSPNPTRRPSYPSRPASVCRPLPPGEQAAGRIDYATGGLPPYERVRFADGPRDAALDEAIMIDTVHDGCVIPPAFLVDTHDAPLDEEDFLADYVEERDWGANLVAEHLARTLGLGGYHRVNIARVLMDFGRFPGTTQRDAEHLHRYAINYPFSHLLSYDQKRYLLERYYDRISHDIEQDVRGRRIKIAIHTYDTHNRTGTIRPATSIVTRSVTYQHHHEMPVGVFDPLYPNILAEFTADRILRDRISLTLERANFPVAHNFPYALPEGSVEVRSQVWFFFSFARDLFQEAFPATVDDPAYQRVWNMLLDTNLRDSDSDTLRSFLHMYRRAPVGREQDFIAARVAYDAIADFVREKDLPRAYRFSHDRPSSMGIEVRKDLVWRFDAGGRPLGPHVESARRIAEVIARAIRTYLDEDKPDHERQPDLDPVLACDLHDHDTWHNPERDTWRPR